MSPALQQLGLFADLGVDLDHIRSSADWAPLRRRWMETLGEAVASDVRGRKALAGDLGVDQSYLSHAIAGGRNRCHLRLEDAPLIIARASSRAPVAFLAALKGCGLKEIEATPEAENRALREALAEAGPVGELLLTRAREKLRGGV